MTKANSELIRSQIEAEARAGVGLGDAVVEGMLPGGEAILAGGHAMEAHSRIGGAKVGAALR